MSRRIEWSDGSVPGRTRAYSRRDLLGWLARGAAWSIAAPPLLGLMARQGLGAGVVGGGANPTAKKMILLWLEGGPSQFETFDPKAGTTTGGPFPSIPTTIPGCSFSSLLPGVAARAHHLAVIRTVTSREGTHARAREMLHTGYSPNPSVPFPAFPAIVAHEIGDLDHDLPAFVQVDGPPSSAGYLGIASSPFRVDDATGNVGNLAYPPGVDPARLDLRESLRDVVDARMRHGAGVEAVESDAAQRRRARRLMDSALRSVFNLESEDDAKRDAYGRNRFGQGVLLARRLIEQGVAAVEVVLDGWDSHDKNATQHKILCDILDPALSTLLDDLAERGLLDQTLVVCMGEFGRTPGINTREGRDHWPNNFSVVLAGGGVKPGVVYGETDELGVSVKGRPVQVADLFATLAKVLGIDGTKEFNRDRRPATLVDKNGIPLDEIIVG